MMFTYCPPKELQDLQSTTFPDGKRYYTLPDGTRLPSVTTVVGAQKKQIFIEWRKRVGDEEANRITRKATSRGTNVHKICEQDRKSTRLNSSHIPLSRMPSSA